MHGQQHIKICTAKQAKEYTDIRPLKQNCIKNAAIWFNKTCRIKQLTPSYINIRVNGNNPKSERTKKSAIRYRINQELKFQYTKKNYLMNTYIKHTWNVLTFGRPLGKSYKQR